GIDTSKSLMITLGVVIVWMSVRRFRSIEIEPLFSIPMVRRHSGSRDGEWLAGIAPFLTAERTEAMRAFVAQLAEKDFKLVRFARAIDPGTAQSLGSMLQSGARLAVAVSEIETSLRNPIFAERAQRYASLSNQVRHEDDPKHRDALEERLGGLRQE